MIYIEIDYIYIYTSSSDFGSCHSYSPWCLTEIERKKYYIIILIKVSLTDYLVKCENSYIYICY